MLEGSSRGSCFTTNFSARLATAAGVGGFSLHTFCPSPSSSVLLLVVGAGWFSFKETLLSRPQSSLSPGGLSLKGGALFTFLSLPPMTAKLQLVTCKRASFLALPLLQEVFAFSQCRNLSMTRVLFCLSLAESFCCILPLPNEADPLLMTGGDLVSCSRSRWVLLSMREGSELYACPPEAAPPHLYICPSEEAPWSLLSCSHLSHERWLRSLKKSSLLGVVSFVCATPSISTVIFTHMWLLWICQNIRLFSYLFFGLLIFPPVLCHRWNSLMSQLSSQGLATLFNSVHLLPCNSVLWEAQKVLIL